MFTGCGMNVPDKSATTENVGVQDPNKKTIGNEDGCRQLETRPIKEQG